MNNIIKILQFFLLFIILFYLLSLVLYSVACFVNQSVNPLNWSSESVLTFSFLELVIGIFSLVVAALKTKAIEI